MSRSRIGTPRRVFWRQSLSIFCGAPNAAPEARFVVRDRLLLVEEGPARTGNSCPASQRVPPYRLPGNSQTLSRPHIRRRRRGEIEQAGGAQLVDARQFGQGVQAEMR